MEETLSDQDILSCVTFYQLSRMDGTVSIEVHEVLFGSGKGLFIAFPTRNGGRTKQEYTVTSNSHNAALLDCLGRLKGVPLKAISEGSSSETGLQRNTTAQV
jgi:hypothetical protein